MHTYKQPKEIIEQNPSLLVHILNYLTVATSIVCYGLIFYIIFYHYDLVKLFFTDYTQLEKFISPSLKVPIFLAAFVLNTILSINPFAQLVPLTSIIAFFYGIKWGMLFGSSSFFLATYLTVLLSRNLDHRVVKKIIGEANWGKVNILADEEGVLPFFIAYLFPIFPNAIISWVAGVTKINPLKLSISAVIAQSPGIFVSVLIGSGIVAKSPYLTGGLFITLVIVSVLLTRYRKELVNLINKTK